jgi:acetylglutamate kinase
VIKIGGRALERDGASVELASALSALQHPVVLVHGGGAEVSTWSRRLGQSPSFVDGRRVTDAETLEVAVAVLAGLANKRLVATLRAGGVDAIGLAALDGGVVETHLHPETDRLGAVGSIAAVAPALLETLLAGRRVPVVASIGACEGCLLNLNADDLAAALAVALHARALVLLSDVPGVVLDGSVVSRLSSEDAALALAGAEVTGGMRPKLEAARLALASGVSMVHLGAWRGPSTLGALLDGAGRGTTLVAAEPADV